MTIAEFMQHYPETKVSSEEIIACRYLESRTSLRFLVDYGYNSAPYFAWSLVDPDGMDRLRLGQIEMDMYDLGLDAK